MSRKHPTLEARNRRVVAQGGRPHSAAMADAARAAAAEKDASRSRPSSAEIAGHGEGTGHQQLEPSTSSARHKNDHADPEEPGPGGEGEGAGEPDGAPGAPPPEDTRTKAQTTLIIAALSSALFLAALDVTIVTVAIPTIAQEFQSTAGYTWIGSAYMLASAAAAPMWGKISDIWGRKPIMLMAVGVFWIGSLLSAVSRDMGMLIAARAIQGVGGGGITILVNVCISDLFSMRRRGERSNHFSFSVAAGG